MQYTSTSLPKGNMQYISKAAPLKPLGIDGWALKSRISIVAFKATRWREQTQNTVSFIGNLPHHCRHFKLAWSVQAFDLNGLFLLLKVVGACRQLLTCSFFYSFVSLSKETRRSRYGLPSWPLYAPIGARPKTYIYLQSEQETDVVVVLMWDIMIQSGILAIC